MVNRLKDTLFKRHQFKVVIADESHNIKSREAQRTQVIVPLLQSATRRILLSGTPALSRPAELWPQLEALDSQIFPSFRKFGIRYCAGQQIDGMWDFSGSSNLAELHAVLRDTIMIRRMKADVLTELPEKRRQLIYLDLNEADTANIQQSLRGLDKNAGRFSGANPTTLQLFSLGHSSYELFILGGNEGGMGGNTMITQLYQETSRAKVSAVREYFSKLLDEIGASTKNVGTIPPMPQTNQFDLPGSPKPRFA